MYKNILLPIDVMEDGSNRLALPVVLELVQAFKSMLHVMTCVPNFGMSMVSQYFPDKAEDTIIKGATEALHKFTEVNIRSSIVFRIILGSLCMGVLMEV